METNNLGRAGASFVRACKKIKWSFKDERRIASLEPVIKSLKHLQPRKGFVYETVLPLFAGYRDLDKVLKTVYRESFMDVYLKL